MDLINTKGRLVGPRQDNGPGTPGTFLVAPTPLGILTKKLDALKNPQLARVADRLGLHDKPHELGRQALADLIADYLGSIYARAGERAVDDRLHDVGID